jgi:hypothetical protein
LIQFFFENEYFWINTMQHFELHHFYTKKADFQWHILKSISVHNPSKLNFYILLTNKMLLFMLIIKIELLGWKLWTIKVYQNQFKTLAAYTQKADF